VTSIVYRHPLLYELAMRALYGRHYRARLRAVAGLIAPGASVVDLCCGPSALYRRELAARGVSYLGVDINRAFLKRLARQGARTLEADIAALASYPPADHVIMLGSLYHFLPGADAVLARMLAAARRTVVVAEPIRNLTASRSRLLRAAAARLSDPGTTPQALRFDERSLDALVARSGAEVERAFRIPGGREKVYVLRGRGAGAGAPPPQRSTDEE
jgi:trans-aconitate methyltransferase